MGWRAVTLTYRATAPLLLGDFPLGFIQRTRRFIPGWTLWGALTALLTRTVFAQADSAHYAAVGAWVSENLLTSYAYLLVGAEPAAPHFQEGRWYYGPLPAAQFEARFVTSLGQTAIAPESLTAQTNTLHETEALSPCDLATGAPARWQFTLYRREGEPTDRRISAAADRQIGAAEDPRVTATLAALSWEEVLAALHMLTVGAERTYGLGRLALETAGTPRPAPGAAWPAPVDWDGKTLRAHAGVAALDGAAVRGRAEAIPWRRWKNTTDPDGKSWGPGQQQEVHCYYVPGCEVAAPGWAPALGPYGLWQEAT